MLLSLAGALPFLFCAGMMAFVPADERHAYLRAMIAYAAVILSFLGGIQWGTALSIAASAPRSATTLFILSIVPSLLAWAVLLIEADHRRIFLAIFLFGLVWAIDALLYLQKLIPRWFFQLRCGITPVVIACLTSTLFFS